MAAVLGIPWHEGENSIREKLRAPENPNPTQPFLYPRGAVLISEAPLLALGTLDDAGRPWTSLWGGSAGFAQPLGHGLVGLTAEVAAAHDPVVQACEKVLNGGNVKITAEGKMMSGLSMDLDRRNRVKLAGRMLAGGVDDSDGNTGVGIAKGSLKLVSRVDQSLANCPKYINRKNITPVEMTPSLELDSAELSQDAADCIAQCDTMFVSSSHNDEDMDTNHRGGAPGFIRSAKDPETGKSIVVWPEYSGNRLYQTLGNLESTPKAGLVIPNFSTGDVLYVTGDTKILIAKEAEAVIPRSNLAIQLTVTRAIFVKSGLPFRGEPVQASPYNPRVRPLATETDFALGNDLNASEAVTLVSKTAVTPSIVRFRFRMLQPKPYKAGQWAALDFSRELDIGYSHMRNDDPTSLNDDFIRTFTISSAPKSDVPSDCFEMTIKKVGRVTEFMSKIEPRVALDIPLRGFGGDFEIEQPAGNAIVPFIAGGVGITPLLSCLPYLDAERIKLYWSVPADEINLVVDTLKQHPGLVKLLECFVTGSADEVTKEAAAGKMKELGGRVYQRRIQKTDLEDERLGNTWYLCTGTSLRNSLLAWLPGKDVHYENFNF